MSRINSAEELKKVQDRFASLRDPNQKTIVLCAGSGCLGCGAQAVVEAFKEQIAEKGMENEVVLRVTGCHGFCERGTLCVINPEGIFYQQVKSKNVSDILEKTIRNGEIIKKLQYKDPKTGKKIVYEKDVAFYQKQRRLIFGNNGHLDPTLIGDYLALDGYSGLARALTEMEPEQIINDIVDSGLRGRGGGGFPTGRKWKYCRAAKGTPKYVICNADEGDPGAYMDRSLLEGNPHSVLEGMIIGAIAIGSHEGYIYARNEYPLAVKNVNIAIKQAREYGLLGDNILGSGFSFDIKVNRGGGAFICGESTALMMSLEGKVGRPRAKYIHTVEHGLWDKPTTLNNVETWANVPYIINKGVDWYRSMGTEGSPGTKVFSLVGKINNTGLVEVPMGIALREIIEDIGGGVLGGKKFKAVQTGGPSGGCIPADQLDVKVDFDTLTELGSMMGSGGMIVMDEDTCMVDVARYFIEFLKEESCGKCVPCREGIKQMHTILERICAGEGEMEDIDILEGMAQGIRDGSLCALGSTAPNPVMTTLRYFKDEYIAHIKDKRCPGGVCTALIKFTIDPDACTGCMLCKKQCPSNAITGSKKKPHVINQDKCIQCGVCKDVCKFDSVIVE